VEDDVPERDPQPRPEEQGRAVSQRTLLVAIAGIAGTLIGAAGIVVPLVASAGTRSSSVDTVEVQHPAAGGSTGSVQAADVVEPLQSGLATQVAGTSVDYANLSSSSYAVPVDAPWAELWRFETTNGCNSEQQIAWLEHHGTLIPTPDLWTTISNSASAGSPVTIRNVRLQGTVTAPVGDTVTVSYPVCAGDLVPGIFAHITVGIDPVAVYDSCYAPDAYGTGILGCRVGDGDVAPVPGDPVVFEIVPGGIQDLHLSYDQVADFTGRFVADAEVDGKVSVIDLSPPGPDIVSPAVTRPARLSIGDPELTDCRQNSESEWVAGCTLEQWLAMLAS
jgi:hypothetical protein